MTDDLESKQSVVEQTEGAAKPDTEAQADAQGVSDDVEKALSEWDASVDTASSKSEQKETATESDEVKRLRDEVAAFREERQSESFQRDLNKVIKELRGDFTAEEIDDDHIDIWLNKQAKRDPRLASAWLHRNDDPAKFQRTLNALKPKFAKDHARFRLRDDEATANREAVAHAVRRGANQPSDSKPPDLGKMTTAEYREFIKKNYGYDPGV